MKEKPSTIGVDTSTKMQNLNLVTVVGYNITMLPHILNYYQQFVEEKIFLS